MNKPKRNVAKALQHAAVLTIAITSLIASVTLAWSGIAPLRGAADNTTSAAIERVVNLVAHWLANGDDGVAGIGLLQAPIALITYLLIVGLPTAFGCLVVEWWRHGQGGPHKPRVDRP
ncbi:hypothetical protein OH687_39680 (plasmid) [Burkholderia anthina]|nr:hypothetical protein OH687_39680 [Burkholderia anthina]